MEPFEILIPIIFFSVIGYFKESSVAFMVAAGFSVTAGFSMFDVDPTTRGLSFSLMLWAWAMACVMFSFMMMFRGRVFRMPNITGRK